MMCDFSEIVHYDSPGIPLFIREIDLSSYANSHVLCHWHEDIECIRALTGHMYYSVNGKQILLEEGDGILVTPGQMHSLYSV